MGGGGGGGGGGGVWYSLHYSLKIEPIIQLIKIFGLFIKIRPIIH